MSKQVPWNRTIFECFIKEAQLSQFEIELMDSRIKSVPRSVFCDSVGISLSTYDRAVALLKIKYDRVQKIVPDTLPQRKFSAKETWMDSN